MASASQVPGGPDLNLLSFYLRTEQAKQSYAGAPSASNRSTENLLNGSIPSRITPQPPYTQNRTRRIPLEGLQ